MILTIKLYSLYFVYSVKKILILIHAVYKKVDKTTCVSSPNESSYSIMSTTM